MNSNDNLFRTQSGGIHSISRNSKPETIIADESRPRSAHQDRMYILHAGVVNSAKKKK